MRRADTAPQAAHHPESPSGFPSPARWNCDETDSVPAESGSQSPRPGDLLPAGPGEWRVHGMDRMFVSP